MADQRRTGAIGIMDGAFFVSKKELLGWLNELLGLSYSKIEDTANGAAACQVFDAIFPGKVPLHKVNFGARLQHEMVRNYKVLQDVFARCGVQKIVDVDKLIMAKPLDNLEFMQWVKRYFDLNAPAGLAYEGAERRRAAGAQDSSVVPAARHGQLAPLDPPSTTTKKPQLPPPKQRKGPTTTSTAAVAPAPAPAQQRTDVVEVQVAEFAQLKYTIEVLERERNFYFGKLREVEDLCQATQRGTNPELDVVLTKVLEILYRKDKEKEDATSNPQ